MVVGMIKSLHACAMITQVNTTLLYLSSFKSVKYMCTLNCYTARKNTNQIILKKLSTQILLEQYYKWRIHVHSSLSVVITPITISKHF